jgi:hypothetical protein
VKHRWAKLPFGNRRYCAACGHIQQRRTVRGVYKWLPRAPVCTGAAP